MTVKKNQIVAYLHLYHKDNISGFADFGLLSDLGLPDGGKSVHNVIRHKNLNGLTESQKDEALILLNKYCEVFAKDNFDLGCAVNVQHKITTEDSRPIHSRPIRRSKASKMVVNEEVNKLLEKGLLIPSKSPWAAPLLVVKKKDGSNRVVIDYRKLNNITRKDAYPLPQIDDALDCLGSAQFFSAMDLISGYWQVEMSLEDQEKCAMITTKELF